MKKLLGIILMSSLVSTSAFAGNTSTSDKAPKIERKVVRVVVKENTTEAGFVKSDRKHLVRIYGSQAATAKVFKPKTKSGGMPNLYKH